METIGKSPPRSLGQRLRSLAVAALIVGVLGALIPGGYRAHAQTNPQSCSALTQVTIPSFTLSLTNGAGFIHVDANSNVQPLVDAATNIMQIQLTGTDAANQGCSYPGTIDNNAQVTVSGPVAVGNYQVTTTVAPTSCSTGRDANGVANATAAFCATITQLNPTNNQPTSRNVPCNVNAVLANQVPVGTTSVAVNTTQATLQGKQQCDNYSENLTGTGTTLQYSASTPLYGVGNITPELGSAELLATGLVPALAIFLYRRRQRRVGK